ncbi:hypothetical protein ASJ81_18035 [Methanosarcina spelaei]|uniref:DUF2795 domain-containing protein n=1 Tax=Methanosarcina spelaei TaxID=1036679 RepID=A0A2A2HVF0_9EURY|nr:DUF2795 domain-containing protein [Methanosarcina spelaei]PAV13382.1 hypothetical protein ASJ81_18035 [Methanosarcina spelaei]
MEIVPMDIQHVLQNVKFPAKKNEIIQQAKSSGAMADPLLENLGMLPDKEYASIDEVVKELEKI